MKLRKYQQDIIDKVYRSIKKKQNRIMISSPTGSGKTYIFCSIAKDFQDNGSKVLIVSHRKELLFQASGAARDIGLNPHELTAKTKEVPQGDIVVAMVETVFRRVQNKEEYQEFIRQFDLIIVDEGHISNADKLFRYFNDNTIVLSFSATPYRKGAKNSLSSLYNELIEGPQVADLIVDGFLSKSHNYGMKVDLSRIRVESVDYNSNDMHQEYQRQRVYDGVIKNYIKHVNGKKAILFAASVDSSRDISMRLNAANIPSAHIDALTPDGDRAYIIDAFREGDIRILCNVGIATLGFDVPDCEVVILYRATKSLPLMLQMLGRGSRITEDKNEFYVLDFGENLSQHGFYEDLRSWSLDNDITRFRRETNMVKECPECGELNSLSAVHCKGCDYVWERTRREQAEELIIADLQKLNGFQIQTYSLGKTFQELEIIREHKGYQKQWIYHQLESIEDLAAYGKFMGYAPGWIFYAKKSFKAKTREQRESEIELFKEKIRLEAQR